MSLVLAVDLGGTKTATALVDESGNMRLRQKQHAGRSMAESVEQIALAAQEAGSEAVAVGVIVPGIFDVRTGLSWCPNLWGMEQVALRAALESRIKLPVFVDSDRTGYVLGESWLGAAKGLEDVVFVGVGTGIGVGILSGGRVIRGAHGIAGAAGWMALGPEWEEKYERLGCWEAESAGPSVAAGFGAATAEDVVAAAKRGDDRAIALLEHAARYTGRGVANLVSLLNPEMVVLGGGLLQGAHEWMLDVIREVALMWAQPIAARRCRFELTQLGEDAGLLGAARLAQREIQ